MTVQGVSMSREFNPDTIRIAAFDLDGTVLNQGVMSDAVGNALHALAARGIAVTVCTSRDISQIPPYVLSCFRYRVTANGANVSDSDGNVILDRPMDNRTTLDALKKLHRLKGRSCLYLNGFVLATPGFLLRLLRRTEFLSKTQRDASKANTNRNNTIRFRIGRYVKKHRPGVYRIHTVFRNTDEARAACDEMSRSGAYTPVLLADDSIETTGAGVTKADGLGKLCTFLGCTAENVIAFGDSANDIGMLGLAGYSVGMGNAEDCVRRMVDHITDSVAGDGVATAVKRLFNY